MECSGPQPLNPLLGWGCQPEPHTLVLEIREARSRDGSHRTGLHLLAPPQLGSPQQVAHGTAYSGLQEEAKQRLLPGFQEGPRVARAVGQSQPTRPTVTPLPSWGRALLSQPALARRTAELLPSHWGLSLYLSVW